MYNMGKELTRGKNKYIFKGNACGGKSPWSPFSPSPVSSPIKGEDIGGRGEEIKLRREN